MKKFGVLVFALLFTWFALPTMHFPEAQAQQSTQKLGNTAYIDITIPNGQTTSASFDVGGMNPVGLFIPAAFTGTTISYTVAQTRAGTYTAVRDTTNTVVSTGIVAGGYHAVNHINFYGTRYLKLVSGTAEAADRVVRVQLKQF